MENMLNEIEPLPFYMTNHMDRNHMDTK